MGYYIYRVKKILWLLLAIFVRPFIKVNNNRIFCWAYNFNKYACNPRAITEFLLKNSDFEIYWAFNKNVDISNLDNRIKVVRKYSFKYFKTLYSSKFVLYNTRNDIFDSFFYKKKNQKYIMTWHGPFALKQIEKDAEKTLSRRYLRNAKIDSKMCDLMLSNSKFFTSLIYKSFWYDGEILEKCSPRSDIYYNQQQHIYDYRNVRKRLGLAVDSKIVLYAPTFRGNGKDLDYYQINWDTIIPYFKQKLGGDVEVLLRLHPNIADMEGIELLIQNPHVHNVTNSADITEYLFAADIMISDYTSAMFDYALLHKPCFIYAVDKDEYNRGFYWSFEQLPFPMAENEKELIDNIVNFNNDIYQMKLNNFMKDVWGLDEDGLSCNRLYKWMQNQE